MALENIHNTVFMIDKWVLSTLNGGTLSSLPPKCELKSNMDPQELRQLHWASNKYIQLGFIPSTVWWDNPILQRFSFSFLSFPLECDGVRFRLSTNICEKWLNFEYALQLMINTLFQAVNVIFPLDIEDYPLLTDFGYPRLHVHETTARKCALMSQDAFLPLMAMCSFAISFHPSHPDQPISADPPWVDILINKAKIHLEWVNQVKSSFIGDLSGNIARVGVVVNAQICKWTNTIQPLIRANVSVWVFWSSINQPLQQSPASSVCHGYGSPVTGY
jgi:hypothetical protein